MNLLASSIDAALENSFQFLFLHSLERKTFIFREMRLVFPAKIKMFFNRATGLLTYNIIHPFGH